MTEFNSPKKSSSSNSSWIYILLIGILLLANAYFFYSNYQAKIKTEKLSAQNMDLESEKNQLQVEYNETIAELDQVQKNNQDLNGKMEGLKAEIEEQKKEIDAALKKGNLSKSELSRAKTLISTLRKQAQDFIAEMEILRSDNYKLQEANTVLKDSIVVKEAVTVALAEEKKVVEEQISQLADEKSRLEEEKENLSSIVTKAKILVSDNIYCQGLKIKRSNKRVVTDVAKKVDELNICFDILPNKTLESGESQDVFVRILNPEGVTLSLEKSGSGKFDLAESGQTINYTVKKNIKSFNKKNMHCAIWLQELEYAPGIYRVELYQQGQQIGSSSFTLKKGIL